MAQFVDFVKDEEEHRIASNKGQNEDKEALNTKLEELLEWR